jgi:peptidoglycan/xylan/chitin deacetylase (PgdA/CDA1 family)
MKYLKKYSRKYIFPAIMGLGIDNLSKNLTLKSSLNIMYHGVVSQDSSYFSPRHILKNQFEKHLIYFKKNYNVISVSETFFNLKNNIKPSKKTLSISFDDGYKNNLDIALPLLEKYQIPATFFISSICTEDMPLRCLWTDLIAGLNYFHKHKLIRIGEYEFNNLVDIKKDLSLANFLKSRNPAERDKILDDLVEKYDLISKIQSLNREIWCLLNKEELINLSQSKFVNIGSHGHSHYNLGEIQKEDARKELIISKEKLEKAISKEVNMIAYPDGSYNEAIKKIAEEAGYSGQLAVSYKLDNDVNDNRIMNRHGISATTTFESNMLMLNASFRKKGFL